MLIDNVNARAKSRAFCFKGEISTSGHGRTAFPD